MYRQASKPPHRHSLFRYNNLLPSYHMSQQFKRDMLGFREVNTPNIVRPTILSTQTGVITTSDTIRVPPIVVHAAGVLLHGSG